ncbi:unnamed protein product [Leptidea sinapis]|uniref:Uncharacterized protein n=1 Tax=Leptidea sinapis TaxID=189913 RepID=A0A5E4Q9W7_9NEOP|nr:unnamed protein product [Leptidea sinapis]
MATMTDHYGTTGTLSLKWDPKNLEIRTMTGKSKRASALVATVERATEIFIERGQTIAYENPEITQEMLTAVEEVEKDLDKLKSASSQSELIESARQFSRSAAELAAQAAKRQRELKEPRMKDELAAARAVLKKNSTMLLTASKLAAAKANRDYVLRAVCSAVDTISAVAQGAPLPPSDAEESVGDVKSGESVGDVVWLLYSSFLETNVPLLVLMEAARSGNEKEVEEYAVLFTEHANKLLEVMNACRVLAARCRSRVAQENASAFGRAWEAAVRLLTDAVDDLTTIDDFLAVSENHILEDVNKCVVALQEGDPDSLERTAGAIRSRAARVCSVVSQEMDNYEPCIYTKRVLEAVTVLRDQG